MYILCSKGPIIIYRQGELGGGGGGAGNFRGDHLSFGRTKGGSVVTENPKGGITGNFGRIQRGGPLKFFWKMKTWRAGGGDAKNIKSYLGGRITSMK